MIRFKTKWKLGALLLAAPLLLPMASARADYNVDYDATELRDALKSYKVLRSTDGDVFLFKKDGHFEARWGRQSAKKYGLAADYGRFTVKPIPDTDGRPDGPKYYVDLRISSSKRKAGGKSFARNDKRYLTLRAMSNYEGGDNPDGPVPMDAVVYMLIEEKRFNGA